MKLVLSVLTTRLHSIRSNAFTLALAALLSLSLASAPQVFAGEKSAAKAPAVKQQSQAKININSASIEDLTNLKGVGEKKAIAIVKYRNEKGKFKSLEQLTEVKGIGLAIVDKNRAYITL